MRYSLQLLIICLLSGMLSAAAAQTGTVEGTVTDGESGESLPGVNITIEGTTTGTTTNMSGEYSITVNDPGAKLVFSYVGYQTQSISLTEAHFEDALDVSLSPDVALMDEMVVVGRDSAQS